MTRRLQLLLLIALLTSCVCARAANPVRRLSSAPQTGDHQAAAQSVDFPWGNDGENEAVSHVLLRLEERDLTLTVGLPAVTPPAAAEGWMQELVDSLGWSRARLYSYRASGQLLLVAETQIQVPTAGPFHRRAVIDVGMLQYRLQKLTRRPALLCVQIIDATVTTVVPTPPARVKRGSATYLFYSGLPPFPAWLAVTYGLSARQIAALLAVLVLALLFPLGPHLAFRSHLQKQPKLTDERRQELYSRWQRGVRTAGVLGTYLSILLLGWSAIPFFFMPAMPVVVPLWWWYGALERFLPLPNASAESGVTFLKRFPRWVNYAGILALGVLTALVMLYAGSVTPQGLAGLVTVLPWVIGACILAVIAIPVCMALWLTWDSRRLKHLRSSEPDTTH